MRIILFLLVSCLTGLSQGLPYPLVSSKRAAAAAGGTSDYTNNLALWIKPQWETLYSAGNSATQFTDFSGAGHHFTNRSSTAPTYQTAVVNGKAVFRFNGTDQFIEATTNFFSVTGTDTNAECYLVIKIANDPPAVSTKSGLWAMGFAGNSQHFPYTDGTLYETWGSATRVTSVDPTPSLASWRLYSVRSGGTAWTNLLDTVALSSDASGFDWGSIAVPYRLGRSYNAEYLDGDIAEFRIYSPPLSGANRTTVETALDTEYNLAY